MIEYVCKILLVISIILLSLLQSCASSDNQAHLGTIAGPEILGLNKGLNGILCTSEPGGGIRALSLTSLKSHIVREAHDLTDKFGPVSALCGPDNNGDIAYMEALDNKFRVNLISIDGKDNRVLFTRIEPQLGYNYTKPSFALSPAGNKIAFLTDYHDDQQEEPPALLKYGTIEIWDIKKNKSRKLPIKAYDLSLSWFPDGKRLAYVDLIPQSHSVNYKDFGIEYKNWSNIPVTFILDTETGAKSMLGIGWNPIVSLDGKHVIVRDGKEEPHLVTVLNHVSVPLKAPGLWMPLAMESNYLIYFGLRTQGMKLKLTENNSPLSGPKDMLSIKLAIINSNKFKTLIPYFDTRMEISYGNVTRHKTVKVIH